EGRWSSLLGLKDIGTPCSSILSGSVWRAAEAGGVSVWPVGEGAWVARFLPVWLLDSTLSGSAWRAAGIGRISFSPVGEEARVTRFLVDGLLAMFDPSLAGQPERTLGLGSDFHAGPASHSPGRGVVHLDTAGPFRSLDQERLLPPPSHRAGYDGACPQVIGREPPEG